MYFPCEKITLGSAVDVRAHTLLLMFLTHIHATNQPIMGELIFMIDSCYFCPKGLLCGRVSKNHVCPSVCVYVCRLFCVAFKNDQVLNGKTSVSKVNGSKRDPKRDQIDGLIARF